MTINNQIAYNHLLFGFTLAHGVPLRRTRRDATGCVQVRIIKRARTAACVRISEQTSGNTRSGVSRRDFLSIGAFCLPTLLLSTAVAAGEKVRSAYDIIATKDGSSFPLKKFSGGVTLFVNVATYCALTPQYGGLVSLYDKFQPRGFEIVASPCDQFGHQEPGKNEDICRFAKEKFGARFLLLDKLNVNDGPGGVAPLYQFLRNNSPEGTGQRVSWNFEKFLVGSDGRVLRRYKPGVLPEQIDADIAWALDHPEKDLLPKKKPSLGVE